MGSVYGTDLEGMEKCWLEWFTKWNFFITNTGITNVNATAFQCHDEFSRQIRLVNPKYSLREWFVVPT